LLLRELLSRAQQPPDHRSRCRSAGVSAPFRLFPTRPPLLGREFGTPRRDQALYRRACPAEALLLDLAPQLGRIVAAVATALLQVGDKGRELAGCSLSLLHLREGIRLEILADGVPALPQLLRDGAEAVSLGIQASDFLENLLPALAARCAVALGTVGRLG